MNQNNNALVWLIAAGAGLLIWIGIDEYREVKTSVSEFQTKVTDAVDETTLLVQSIRKTINDLREKISFLETQHQALESRLVEANKPTAKEEPKLSNKQVIVMHSMANCTACAVWKSQHMAEWKANGFEVRVKDEAPISGFTYPYFDVFDGDKISQWKGVLSWTTYRKQR